MKTKQSTARYDAIGHCIASTVSVLGINARTKEANNLFADRYLYHDKAEEELEMHFRVSEVVPRIFHTCATSNKKFDSDFYLFGGLSTDLVHALNDAVRINTDYAEDLIITVLHASGTVPGGRYGMVEIV